MNPDAIVILGGVFHFIIPKLEELPTSMMLQGRTAPASLCAMREPTEEMAKSHVFLSLQVRIILSRNRKMHEYQLIGL
jgi:hypothetical protein